MDVQCCQNSYLLDDREGEARKLRKQWEYAIGRKLLEQDMNIVKMNPHRI